MEVELVCSDPSLAYHGTWREDEAPEALVQRLLGEARRRGIPIQLTITGHGTWSIAPNGRVIWGALFEEQRLPKKRAAATNA